MMFSWGGAVVVGRESVKRKYLFSKPLTKIPKECVEQHTDSE